MRKTAKNEENPRKSRAFRPVSFKTGTLGGTTRNRTGDKGFADLCLTAWLWCHKYEDGRDIRREDMPETPATGNSGGKGEESVRERNADTNDMIRIRKCGADYGARTRHLDLGKVALYQMS